MCTQPHDQFSLSVSHAGDPPGLLNSSQIFGIIFGLMALIFIVLPFTYACGKGYWRRRHSYSWYNTLMSPSCRAWCKCCHRSGGSITLARRRNRQSPNRSNAHLTAISPMTPVSTINGPTFIFVSLIDLPPQFSFNHYYLVCSPGPPQAAECGDNRT